MEEQQNYLSEMLDMNDSNHLNFIMEFNSKLQGANRISALAPAGMVAYKKSDDKGIINGGARPKTSKQKLPPQPTVTETKKENSPALPTTTKKAAGKFVPLFSKDGRVQSGLKNV